MDTNRRQNALARSNASEMNQGENEHLLQSMRAHSLDIDARLARAQAQAEKRHEVKLQDLSKLSISPILRMVHNWWLQRAERHFLICADVELQRMREAQMNIAYYQKRAAMARSARSA